MGLVNIGDGLVSYGGRFRPLSEDILTEQDKWPYLYFSDIEIDIIGLGIEAGPE